jgi:hypothetical protein
MSTFLFQQTGGGSGGGAYTTQNFTGVTITPTTDGFQRWVYTGVSFLTLSCFINTAITDASVLQIVAGTTFSFTINDGTSGIIRLNGPWEGSLGQCINLQYGVTLGGLYEVSRT